MISIVAETIEALERRIDELRVAVREAVLAGDRALAVRQRSALTSAERAWEDALEEAAAAQTDPSAPAGPVAQARAAQGKVAQARAAEPPARPGSLLPLREQVYEALSLLQVPAAP